MSNTANSITLLNNLKSVITALEAGNLKTGNYEIDQQTRAIIATRLDILLATVWDNGSRAQQATTSAQRAANTNAGAGLAVDQLYRQLDDFVKSIDAQVAVLNAPTSVPRRSHVTLQ
jgi:hypothetical protein